MKLEDVLSQRQAYCTLFSVSALRIFTQFGHVQPLRLQTNESGRPISETRIEAGDLC